MYQKHREIQHFYSVFFLPASQLCLYLRPFCPPLHTGLISHEQEQSHSYTFFLVLLSSISVLQGGRPHSKRLDTLTCFYPLKMRRELSGGEVNTTWGSDGDVSHGTVQQTTQERGIWWPPLCVGKQSFLEGHWIPGTEPLSSQKPGHLIPIPTVMLVSLPRKPPPIHPPTRAHWALRDYKGPSVCDSGWIDTSIISSNLNWQNCGLL